MAVQPSCASRVDPASRADSAGGELVSLVSNYPSEYAKAPRDTLTPISARPDFQVLVYPGPLAVKGPVPASAPPAFLVGYGLDHAENYRHLPFIADLE